tara:strand:- start:696 stop:1220 length:525 start_codon:yes stop_codon:yes gene_type:complete
MKSLIIYSSTDGQTKKICEKILDHLKNKISFDLVSVDNALGLNFENYEKIVIGASIRYGRYNSKIYKLINKNLNILENKQSSFFSVNVVARKKEKNTPETNPYIKKFYLYSRWKPKIVDVFAGKVDYPNYNFINKIVIKLIMYVTKGPTDTSQSYEFTDWNKVKQFAFKIQNFK